jgi:hypothetical protein
MCQVRVHITFASKLKHPIYYDDLTSRGQSREDSAGFSDAGDNSTYSDVTDLGSLVRILVQANNLTSS